MILRTGFLVLLCAVIIGFTALFGATEIWGIDISFIESHIVLYACILEILTLCAVYFVLKGAHIGSPLSGLAWVLIVVSSGVLLLKALPDPHFGSIWKVASWPLSFIVAFIVFIITILFLPDDDDELRKGIL